MAAFISGNGDPHSGTYRAGYATGETDATRYSTPRVVKGDRSDWARGYMQAWKDAGCK